MSEPDSVYGSAQSIQLNPFRGSVAADAWLEAASCFDVDEIHRNVFETCLTAVKQARTGFSSAGVVVYGAAGSGKTHLVGRLRRRLLDAHETPTLERLSQAFAYVRLNTNPGSLYRHVRERVAADLLKGPRRGMSQLDRMVLTRLMDACGGGGDLAQWREFCLEERRDELPEMISELAQRNHLSSDFVRVITHLVTQTHRLDVAAWLRGESLSEEACARLGIGVPGNNSDPEREAHQVLLDFMRLAGSQLPLVICFDQVEALQNDVDDIAALQQFSKLVHELHDADTNLVLISCMQSTLHQRFRKTPEFLTARMMSFAVKSLLPLDEAQAGKLLRARVRAQCQVAGMASPADLLSPLTGQDVTRIVDTSGGCTPRLLLDQAAQRWDELVQPNHVPDRVDFTTWLSQEWDGRLESARGETSLSESNGVLRDGIPRLVHLCDPQWTVQSGAEAGVLDYLLQAPRREARVGIAICDEDPRQLATQLRKLDQTYSRPCNLQKLVMLRDERRPISPTARKSHEYLASLERHDAVMLPISPEALLALDALRQLLADAAAGDLDFQGEPASINSVLDWLRSHLDPGLQELAEMLMTPSRPEIASPLPDLLQEFLATNYISTLDQAAESLNVQKEQLRTAASERSDLFGIVSGETDVVFSTRLGSRGLISSNS